jgi:tetratricopeptide (TPR) repeat protein
MPLDPYAPCPAGTGKKLKFCCADLAGELETIDRMVEGDQRLACIEHIEKLQARYPRRPCLLTTQALLLIELGRLDDAKKVVESALSAAPLNPVALAQSALLSLEEAHVATAIETLQRALASSPTPIPAAVVDVFAGMAEMLVALGQVPAALGHLLLVASLSPNDQRTLALILRLNGSAQVPLLFKEEPDLRSAPQASPWRDRLDEALEPARRGAWRTSADRLAALGQQADDLPEIWHDLAVLRAWLADARGAVDALRRLAALDISADQRIEAEALAQLLDADAVGDRVDVLSVVYAVANFDEITAKLSDRRLVPAPVDPSHWADGNQPPPRNSYLLLDRPAPRTGTGLAREDVPNVIAQLFLFGRETDREARIEATVARPNFAAMQSALTELCGPSLGAPTSEEKQGDVSAAQWALSSNWRPPEDTPADQVHKLLVEERRHAVLERWTRTPLAALQGKTPEQASAGDEGSRIRLSAAILLLELSFQEPSAAGWFSELRRRLGLAEPKPIDPSAAPIAHLPLARLHRVDWTKADDDALLAANRRALFAAAHLAARQIALEIVTRESLKNKVSVAQVFGLLARLEDDTSQALEYLDKARAAAEAVNESTAVWDLQELNLRLERGEPDEFARVLAHVQKNHAREPGVAQALVQILVEAGLMTPDGRPVGAPDEGAALVVPGSAAEPGQIWTPESETTGGKKSALWVPGAE